MYNGIEFMSVFKIAEKPILPPCLSDEKREEIRRFKAEALEIERRITERKKRLATDEKNKKIEFMKDMDTVSIHSDNKTDNDVDNLATSIFEWDLSSIPDAADNNTITMSCCSGTLEALEFDENSYDFADQYDNTATGTAQLSQPIIRSDSFTVDEPSKCFLKHLEDSGVAALIKPTCTSNADLSMRSELNETKIIVKETVKRKTESKKITTPKHKKYSTKLYSIKKGRLSSDNISNLPEIVIRKNQNKSVNLSEFRKEKPTIKPFISSTSRKTSISQQESPFPQAPIPYKDSTDENFIDQHPEVIANVEEKYRTEIVFFLEKQKREQDAFLRKVMSEMKSKQDTFQHGIVMQIKALIDDSLSKVMNNQTNVLNPGNINCPTNDPNGNVSIVHEGDTKVNNCATKINACIRGYLTRRLLKTEHVQQIVKIIRDSRDLLIDLHLENTDDDSPAEVQMKHNLLQQLQTNKRTLLNIFTTNTTAERMGMIAFDRQMINFRLVQNNVRNNNKCTKEPTFIDQRPDYTIENKLKKLKIVKLFSDSISGNEAMACSNQFEDT